MRSCRSFPPVGPLSVPRAAAARAAHDPFPRRGRLRRSPRGHVPPDRHAWRALTAAILAGDGLLDGSFAPPVRNFTRRGNLGAVPFSREGVDQQSKDGLAKALKEVLPGLGVQHRNLGESTKP
jgi:hypothetical protein